MFKDTSRNLFAGLSLLDVSLIITFLVVTFWAVSAKTFNKLMHAKYGNGLFTHFAFVLPLLLLLLLSLSYACGQFVHVIRYWICRVGFLQMMPKKLCKARLVGSRRATAVRVPKMRILKLKTLKVVLYLVFTIHLLFALQIDWSLPSRDRNRLMHMTHGNGMGGGKAKGRGKGNSKGSNNVLADTSNDPAEADRMLRESIRQAIPAQARYRAQSTCFLQNGACSLFRISRLVPVEACVCVLVMHYLKILKFWLRLATHPDLLQCYWYKIQTLWDLLLTPGLWFHALYQLLAQIASVKLYRDSGTLCNWVLAVLSSDKLKALKYSLIFTCAACLQSFPHIVVGHLQSTLGISWCRIFRITFPILLLTRFSHALMGPFPFCATAAKLTYSSKLLVMRAFSTSSLTLKKKWNLSGYNLIVLWMKLWHWLLSPLPMDLLKREKVDYWHFVSKIVLLLVHLLLNTTFLTLRLLHDGKSLECLLPLAYTDCMNFYILENGRELMWFSWTTGRLSFMLVQWEIHPPCSTNNMDKRIQFSLKQSILWLRNLPKLMLNRRVLGLPLTKLLVLLRLQLAIGSNNKRTFLRKCCLPQWVTCLWPLLDVPLTNVNDPMLERLERHLRQKLRNSSCLRFHFGHFGIGAFAASVNVYMRITNGNTVARKSSKKLLQLGFINSDGVIDKTRYPAFQALQCDILAICETHLTAELQHAVRHSFSGYDAFWGAPATGKAGVGFLVKHGAVWHAESMTWNSSSTCFPFYQKGRLHGLTIWVGDGRFRMNLYILYGHSGARWNDGLRQQTHSLIQSVLDDSAEKGLPALFGGDINLSICDSDLLQRLPQLEWTSLADMVQLTEAHTCFKGKGSTIDFLFANTLALMAFQTFHIGDRQGLADHAPLLCQLDLGIVKQLVVRNRHYGTISADFDFTALQALQHAVCTLDPYFYTAIDTQDVDTAFKYWNTFAEKHLQALWTQCSSTEFRQGRGSVRLTSSHVWPQVRRAGPASLQVRRLWKHNCKMVAIQKQPFGVVAERTWNNARNMLQVLPGHFREPASELLAESVSIDRAAALQKILESSIEFVQAAERKQRIKQWKSRLQNSTKSTHAWLKHKNKSSSMCFADDTGTRTANVDSLFRAVRQAWCAVHELFKDGEPSWDSFQDAYGHLINPASVSLEPLTGELLRKECLATSPTCPGFDLWLHGDLKILALGAPWVFDALCTLLQLVETTGVWPPALIAGFTSLIPKDGVSIDHPGDLRPLTVCSSIYRLWARIRARQLGRVWQPFWAHDELWGGRPGRSAEPLFVAVSLDLELCPANHHIAGLSFDLSKAFDRIPRELLGKLLQQMSMPSCVLLPYMNLLRFATRRFKLGPWLDKSQPIYGGILQGCPLSMIAINAVVNIWLRLLSQITPSSCPRAYVDDVSITVTNREVQALRQQVQDLLTSSLGFVQTIGGKLNVDKSFSFGSQAIRGRLQPNLRHCDEFRLVGGSIAAREIDALNATQLELRRMKAWQQTIDAAIFLLFSWHDRCGVLLRTRSQYTWGVATHSLCMARTHLDTLNKLRTSSVMKCLLRRSQYIAKSWGLSCFAYFPFVVSALLPCGRWYQHVLENSCAH